MPCTALARLAGDDRLVSLVALGALVGRRGPVTAGSVERALERVTGSHHPELAEVDLAAFRAGYEAGLVPVIA